MTGGGLAAGGRRMRGAHRAGGSPRVEWARTRWVAAPLAACGVSYAGLAAVRVAGAFSIPLMVLSIAAMPAVLVAAPPESWRLADVLAGRPGRVFGAALGVVILAYAVTVAGSFAAYGSSDDNWLTGMPRLFRELVPGSELLRLLVMAACLGVAVPLVEEVCYRGVFFHAVLSRSGPLAAVLVTSALWAVVHLGDYGLHPYRPAVILGSQLSVFVMGLGLGWCRLVTGSVAACVVAQGTANLLLYGFLMVVLG